MCHGFADEIIDGGPALVSIEMIGAKKMMASKTSNAVLTGSILKKVLQLYHPQWSDINCTVHTLRKLGANPRIIAASLGLNGLQSYCGCADWNEREILRLL
jgi:hypothetical protein